jgi:hypothetical protein
MNEDPTLEYPVVATTRTYEYESPNHNHIPLLACIVASVIVIVVGAIIALSVINHGTPSTTVISTPPAAVQPTTTNTTVVVTPPPTTTTVVTPPAATPSVGQVTETDGSGYNVGVGCSDNPSSSLPGCSDSPSISGTVGACDGGITIDSSTTGCGYAENVQQQYTGDGIVSAWSPVLQQWVGINCQTAPSGTTGYTICTNSMGSYVRWHS